MVEADFYFTPFVFESMVICLVNVVKLQAALTLRLDLGNWFSHSAIISFHGFFRVDAVPVSATVCNYGKQNGLRSI